MLNHRSCEVGQRGGLLVTRSLAQDRFCRCRISEPLLAAEVPFRCLNADITEQELNLFKLPARLMTQTGAGTTKIVRRNPIQTAL
jgi:hypothetical protein